ncbi:MAG: putative selenium-dependent hydroxylase accessory protein YqeC [Deltaproteobacteria bacterium]|nr:putative selenium-dependent hydroxylase accessory protein YqeC [Deltaproteobacteria bacterium]
MTGSASDLISALELRAGDLVALVGAGGKTSLMYRLAAELRRVGVKAAAGTTTKIALPAQEEGTLFCVGSFEEAAERVRSHEGVPVLAGKVLENGKVRGIPPEWCDRLVSEGGVEVLLVEADGSARKALKAPEAWEPVVPAGTTAFVALAGLTVLGRSLGEEAVFRPERVSAVTGFPLGAPVTVELLAALFTAGEGLLRGRPRGARAYAFLNQIDTPDALTSARRVAAGILASERYRRVIGAALRESEPLKFVAGQGDPPMERASPLG